MEQVEKIIFELGLTKCTNTMIGGALFRGVSGGERKRPCEYVMDYLCSLGLMPGHNLINPADFLLDLANV
ncbi:ABC transporter G family member 14, partial [Bienertia sinuspersici]